MTEEIKVATTEEEVATRRYYTHVIVSYATEEEVVTGLLSKAKHWAYIVHDKDGTDKHVHAIVTFEQQKSFNWVRKQVISANGQNTFTEFVKGDVEDVLTYFTHKKETTKHKYSENEIVYSDEEYWRKRSKQDGREEDKNEAFVNDLLSEDYSVEKMARKYGRDFIKNFRAYGDAREYMLAERREWDKIRKMQKEKIEMEQAIEMLAEAQRGNKEIWK